MEVEMENHPDLCFGFSDGSSVERGKGRDRGKVLSLRLAEMNTNMRRDHYTQDSIIFACC